MRIKNEEIQVNALDKRAFSLWLDLIKKKGKELDDPISRIWDKIKHLAVDLQAAIIRQELAADPSKEALYLAAWKLTPVLLSLMSGLKIERCLELVDKDNATEVLNKLSAVQFPVVITDKTAAEAYIKKWREEHDEVGTISRDGESGGIG